MPTPAPKIKPFWQTTDASMVKLYHGNVEKVLSNLPAKSVHCVVTSPPYWGLRDYKAGEDEIGREKTPQEYVERMVGVFEQIKRVLRDDGTVWLNLGDTYSGGAPGRNDVDRKYPGQVNNESCSLRASNSHGVSRQDGLLSGNLVGIPWRVALALQAAGWVLRQDIIWAKPSPMPESVKNRCTKAHEYLFLLTKKMGYYYDAEAIKEKAGGYKTGGAMNYRATENGDGREFMSQNRESIYEVSNKRSVWTVPSQGYGGAHFATFPPKLITPCILAGTSEKGCCVKCGAPWKRLVETGEYTKSDRPATRKGTKENPHAQGGAIDCVGGGHWPTKTVGWEAGCDCLGADTVPCTVLDPFIGSGTTCVVALDYGRRSVGIDLSEVYLRNNAVPRIEGALSSRPGLSGLIPREVKVFTEGVDLLKKKTG